MINGKYMLIQEQIDRVVDNLTDLYYVGCIGSVMIYADGEVVDFETKWISKEAKDNYDRMQQKLKYLLEDQNRVMGSATQPSLKLAKDNWGSSAEVRNSILEKGFKHLEQLLKENTHNE